MKVIVILLISCLAFPLIGQDINEEEQDGPEIYTIVEVPAEFPGGTREMVKFLSQNIDYPNKAQENNIAGTVVLRFVVNKDGSVSDVVVLKKVSPSIDEEALRVVNSMPDWSPGYQRGKAVACYFTLPLHFKLKVDSPEVDSPEVELPKKEKEKKNRRN